MLGVFGSLSGIGFETEPFFLIVGVSIELKLHVGSSSYREGGSLKKCQGGVEKDSEFIGEIGRGFDREIVGFVMSIIFESDDHQIGF